MKIIKPKFWVKKNFISYLLYPLSILTRISNLYRKLSFKKKFSIKTICIGNLYVGGTGKTSLAIEIHKILNKKFKIIFIKKKYEDQKDEINLLKKKGEVISTNDRGGSLTIAQKNEFEIALLDDGLQQKNIEYDLKIVCFNTEESFGNNFLLPAGPLRESANELKNYHLAFLNGEKKNNDLYSKLKAINKNLKIFEGKYEPINLKSFNRKKKYLMFCGIGNPQEFENTLKKYKFDVKYKIIYPDHYMIPDNEINKLKEKAKKQDLTIITTEKDYLRLNKTKRKSIKFLEVKLKIKNMNKLKKILLSNL